MGWLGGLCCATVFGVVLCFSLSSGKGSGVVFRGRCTPDTLDTIPSDHPPFTILLSFTQPHLLSSFPH